MKLNNDHVLILNLVKEGVRRSRIAQILHIKRSTLFGIIETLIKHGYLIRDANGEILLTEKGRWVVDSLPLNKKERFIRLNNIVVKYRLKDNLSSSEPIRIMRMAGILSGFNKLNNHDDALFVYNEIHGKLTTSSLMIYIPESRFKLSNKKVDLDLEVFKISIPIALDLEQKIKKVYPSFKLLREDRNTLSAPIRLEIAIVNDPIAQKLNRHKDIIKSDKTRLVWIDKSTGEPELEFKQYEDFEKYEEMLKDVVEGGYEELKNRVTNLEKKSN